MKSGRPSFAWVVPAFQAVYGGYALFMGAEYFQNDFSPNPNVFAAKIANQLLFGASGGPEAETLSTMSKTQYAMHLLNQIDSIRAHSRLRERLLFLSSKRQISQQGTARWAGRVQRRLPPATAVQVAGCAKSGEVCRYPLSHGRIGR